MAAQYQVNLTISAGADFTQEFSVNSPDQAPVDITGYKFFANLAKHPTAIDAAVSTSGSPVYSYVPFATTIVDGISGRYAISLSPTQTSKLSEGKYVYNIVLEDLNGERTSVVGGIAFVDVAFGSISI